MQQRTRETSTETTETTPSEWALKEGTIPDHNDYPVLHQFGIPIDNKQTTQLLLQELQKCQEQVQGVQYTGTKSLRMPNSRFELGYYAAARMHNSSQQELRPTMLSITLGQSNKR
jgi:hypothetical protein